MCGNLILFRCHFMHGMMLGGQLVGQQENNGSKATVNSTNVQNKTSNGWWKNL